MNKKLLITLIVSAVLSVTTNKVHAWDGCGDDPVVTPAVSFSKDTRNHAAKPPLITWIKIENKQLLWSALIANKIEVRFSENASDLRWRFTTSNDGHEILGKIKNTGILSGTYYFQARGINSGKKGPWSPIFSGIF